MDKKTKIADLPDFDLAEYLESKKSIVFWGIIAER